MPVGIKRHDVKDDVVLSRFHLPSFFFGPFLGYWAGAVIKKLEGPTWLLALPVLFLLSMAVMVMWKTLVGANRRARIAGVLVIAFTFSAVLLVNLSMRAICQWPLVFRWDSLLFLLVIIASWWLSIELMLRLSTRDEEWWYHGE